MGEYTLDLTEVDPQVSTNRHVSAELGVGELTVIVPDGTDVAVNAEAGLGDIVLFGNQYGGTGVSASKERSGAGHPIQVDVRVGVGRVEVITEGDVR